MKQPTKLSRCTVNMLNHRAIILCSEMCNYNQAIEYYQLALILSADLKQCHHYGGTLSSCTKAKIDLCLCSSEDYRNDASRLSLYPCGKIESDEGFYTHTRPLPLLASSRIYDQIHSLDRISFDEIEAILCFNMSICYMFLSDDKEASLYLDRAQDLFTKSPDIHHTKNHVTHFALDLSTLLQNRGLLLFRAGQYDEALQCYMDSMDHSIQMYGRHNFATAAALNAIGMILSRTKEKDFSAIDDQKCLLQSVAIRIHILGHAFGTDKDTATVFNNIGRKKFIEHDFEGALTCHMKAYIIRRRVLGTMHLDTNVALFNIGNCYHYLGQPNLAYQYYILFAEAVFNSEHLELLVEDSVMAFEYIARRLQDSSCEHATTFFKLTLESARRFSNVRNSGTDNIAQILNRCGNVHFDSLKLQNALEFYEQGLEIEMNIYPSNHLNIATTLANIARVHHQEGRVENALNFYKRSKDTYKSNTKAFPSKHCREGIISTLLNMGLLREEQKSYQEALNLFSEALVEQRQENGNTDYSLSCTLNHIGNIHVAMGNTHAALSSFDQSLKIRQFLKAPIDSVIAVLSNIASVHLQRDNAQYSLVYYKKVLDLEFARKDDPRDEYNIFCVLGTFETIATILHEILGKHDEALYYVEQAISICKENGPELVPLGILSKYLGLAGHLKVVIGDINSAINILSELVLVDRNLGFHRWTNFTGAGYDLYIISMWHRPCAPAA